ncbi:uncharacterized protein PAC_11464 [Phialocephala subalpina]|uniref:C2H2-type domain-containing protein n=1 Tax=Phialocephala subalpina TaxID=576137 RepID=A0A1L7X9A8_9HELO|nr:uncharacterized protein PAC_11464 [Phialocephala subalpina]
MTRLKLDQWGSRWSFARGATKATHRTKGQSMTELTEALAEVDGLLAGVNYLERLEPESEETHFLSARSDDANNSLPPNSAKDSWFGHLTFDLPKLDASGSEERSKIEMRNLRNILNEKLINSNDSSRQIPRESQWTTLRSLRRASMYHYKQFTKVTTDSTSADIRRLRKSYITAKNMLDMGILTFRNVLHGQIPTTLVDIFAFASLSYVISKTLHSNGHIDQSDILAGIVDWRAAIADESERSAFDEIANRLWPEAKEILHFIPIKRKELSPETAGLGLDEGEITSAPSSICQEALDTGTSRPGEECISSGVDPLLSPCAHEYASIFQANTLPIPYLSEMQSPPGGLQDYVCQLVQETKSHEDFMFSAWLNLDSMLPEDFMNPSLYQSTEPNTSLEGLNPSQTGYSIETESAPSESSSPFPNGFEEPPQVEQADRPGDDSAPHPLLNTSLFQVVFHFVMQLSEVGDLLHVLSGRGLTSRKDGTKSAHPHPPWATFEFLHQAPRHFFGPLHREAVQIDETFSGIVAMAEMFVRLGSLHTVREVENYIITVGRYLARSDLFAKVVSKTLIQCLIASQSMKWNLLYPNYVQEADEYSIEYINRRENSEKEWADPGFAHHAPSEEVSSPTMSTNKNPQKNSPNPAKRSYQGRSDSASKRHRRDIPNTASQSPLSGSDGSTVERCLFDKCPKSYTGIAARNNLSRHVRTEHHKKKTLKCPNCSKETLRRDNLRQHFLKVHRTHKLPDWIANKSRGLRNAPRSH